MFRMRRVPDEGRASHMLRTGQRLMMWFQSFGIARCHARVLFQYHAWASKVVEFKLPGGERPLFRLLRAKCLQQWNDTKDLFKALDPKNELGWRHAKSGAQSHWEQVLATVHGDSWWDATLAPAWRASRKDFVRRVCDMWGLHS
eukprot:8817423-Karenia_brevis.AAC.1